MRKHVAVVLLGLGYLSIINVLQFYPLSWEKIIIFSLQLNKILLHIYSAFSLPVISWWTSSLTPFSGCCNQSSLCMDVESFGCTLRNDRAGLLVVVFLALWRYLHTDFHSGYTSLHSHCPWFPFLHILDSICYHLFLDANHSDRI